MGSNRLLLVCVVLCALAAGCIGPDQVADRSAPGDVESTYNVTVVEVVDGDTLEVRYKNGTRDTVRLLGVDTPEVHTEVSPGEFESIPMNREGRQWLSRWGDEATAYAREQVAGETVTISVDSEADRRGSFGRLLVYVYDDGDMLNLQLLEHGYARLYESDFSSLDQFREAEEQARAEDVGVWGFRADQDTSGLQVVQIHADAQGNDYDNLNDEFIVIRNSRDQAVDFTGWSVSDAAGHQYVFPDGYVIQPGETVVIRTGTGTDGDGVVYWGAEAPVWNNGGDTITIRNASETVVVRREY